MGKRVLRVRNALTGQVREVLLPGTPVPKKPAVKAPVLKPVEPKFAGEGDGSDNG